MEKRIQSPKQLKLSTTTTSPELPQDSNQAEQVQNILQLLKEGKTLPAYRLATPILQGSLKDSQKNPNVVALLQGIILHENKKFGIRKTEEEKQKRAIPTVKSPFQEWIRKTLEIVTARLNGFKKSLLSQSMTNVLLLGKPKKIKSSQPEIR